MKVLIVDDSIPVQKRLLESLRITDRSMKIFQAFSLGEAIDLFSSVAPEIVILDLELPDGSGISLLRKFKQDRPGTEIIIFTNHSASEFKKSCMDLNARDFIEKSSFFSLMNAVISLMYSHI